MAKYLFLRHGEVYERRVRLNKVVRTIEEESKWHYFTVKEVQMILCNNDISVSVATIRHWIRKKKLLPAFKLGKKRLWRVSQKGFRIFIERMRYLNEKELEFENDPLDMRPQVIEKRRQRRRELPDRDRNGTFKRKREYDHSGLLGRLG